MTMMWKTGVLPTKASTNVKLIGSCFLNKKNKKKQAEKKKKVAQLKSLKLSFWVSSYLYQLLLSIISKIRMWQTDQTNRQTETDRQDVYY